MKRTIILIAALVLGVLLIGGSFLGKGSGGWQENYDLGARYLSEGNYQEAILAFTAAIDIDPKRAEGYLGRAEAYEGLAGTQEGQEREDTFLLAAEDYVRAMELGASEAEFGERAADAFFQAGAYEKAAPYYEKILETTGDGSGLGRIYGVTGDERYLETLRAAWPEAALRAYGELLGADGSQAFALADLDRDGTPELIRGEAAEQTELGVLTPMGYTLYTWRDGGARELYSGYVDVWMNPTIYVSQDGAVVNEGHGTSAGYELQYVQWTGSAVVSHDLYSYDISDGEGDMVFEYQVDGTVVPESEFEVRRAACTQGLAPLIFHRNTAENLLALLRTEFRGLTDEALVAAVTDSVWWLNECAQETFGVECDWDNAIQGGEPTYSTYYPVTNYASAEAVRAEAERYVAADYLAALPEDLQMVDGRLCLVRGGRGYGVISYDIATLGVVENRGDRCVIACDRYYFDMLDCRAELSLEEVDGDWRVTGVSYQGAAIAFDSPVN